MLHESETWPVRKENVVALQRAEMRMVRWMRWYGHVLQKDDDDWVKNAEMQPVLLQYQCYVFYT